MKQKITLFLFLTFSLIISACSPVATQTQIPPINTSTPIPQSTQTKIPVPTETPTPSPLPPVVSANEQINCYSGPGENGYIRLATFESGEQMDVVGKDASDQYWIVIDRKSNKGCWVESQYTSAHGETHMLPNLIPPPTTVLRPNPPENLKITFKCEKVFYRYRNHNFRVIITISWEDKSDNETGFEIYKDTNPWKTNEENNTQVIEIIESERTIYNSTTYTVFALNDVGKSTRVEKSIQYSCP
jgi:hypothetical protein